MKGVEFNINKVKRFNKIFLFTIIFLFSIFLVSCSIKDQMEENMVEKETDEINSDKNTTVEKPERVLGVGQKSIELLLMLGLEDSIIGVTEIDYPVKDELRYQFETISCYINMLSKEEMEKLDPDFILYEEAINKEEIKKFKKNNDIITYEFKNKSSEDIIESEYEDIIRIGEIFEKKSEAEKIVEDMRFNMEQLRKNIRKNKSKEVIIVEHLRKNEYILYGEETVGGKILSEIEMDLLFKNSKIIKYDDLIKMNPDIIFVTYSGNENQRKRCVSRLLNNKYIENITAIKEERVYPIMKSEVYNGGIRINDAICNITKNIYIE